MVPYLGWGSAASTHGKQASREESEVNDLVADGLLDVEDVVERRQMS